MTPDWTVLQEEGVEETCRKVAASVARDYAGIVERDDLLQEAYIACATCPQTVRLYLDTDIGHLYRWLWCDLVDRLRPQARRSNRTVSTTRLLESE